MKLSFALIPISLAAAASSARTFNVMNNCNHTIWPAIYTDLNVGSAVPNQVRGWRQDPGGPPVTFTVPDDWKSGRIWGRTGCDFTTNPGASSCATGGCNGGLICDANTGIGVPPVTLAEWTLGNSASGTPDYYDVSLVDGSNLPMMIQPTRQCPAASCPVDLNLNCPAALAKKDASGNVVGCQSACLANLDGNPANSGNCCTGSHSTAATCPSSGVQEYSYFKTSCPNSYVYAYDEGSGTALFSCSSTLLTGYIITFCP